MKILNVFISVLFFWIVNYLRDRRIWVVFISPVSRAKFSHNIPRASWLELWCSRGGISSNKGVLFFQSRQLCVPSLIVLSETTLTKQSWHHNALDLWENLSWVKRENFFSVWLTLWDALLYAPELTGKNWCEYISLTSEHLFPSFLSIDVIDMLLTQIRQFSGSLWCLWFLWLPAYSPFIMDFYTLLSSILGQVSFCVELSITQVQLLG